MDRIPSRAEILDWLEAHPTENARRDIARAFGVKGAGRAELARLLQAMAAEGEIAGRPRRTREPATLPPVTVLEALAPDAAGDVFARPIEWRGDGAPPRILMVTKPGDPALGPGDRILARLAPVAGEGHGYEGRVMRRLTPAARRVLGVFRKSGEGGRIVPIDKGEDREWLVPRDLTAGAKDGELVEAEPAGPRPMGLPRARVTARLGDPSAPRAVSLIAIRQHGLRDDFPEAALAEAEAAAPPEGAREDLRHLPLITIDPADARDHDDAVWAHPDDNPANPGGHVLWVAIADVAAYVRPQSALDREARARGNSTYFPDRVVPMLPERLSADLCSLIAGADRPAIAVRMTIDERGRKTGHRFVRALIRCHAGLAYEQVQAARDGAPDAATAPLVAPVIAPLYAAFAALTRARAERQPLDLDLPERRIVLSDDGRVQSVAFRERLDAHRLIEEFMVLANVAAAEELERLRRPLLYRVHEEPEADKLDALREVAQASGLTLARGQGIRTAHLNRLLAQAAGTDQAELLNITTLRSMPQAYYAPGNLGHFGLALRSYAHFTSPIRRYADLIVHRALIAAHGWGEDGLSRADIEMLDETAKAISEAERRSLAAERDTTDRYLAAWLSDRVGAEFAGRIAGVQRFGLFVKLDETGADGLVPIRSVGREFFHYDAATQTLQGADSGMTLAAGQRVTVRLLEAVPVTGGLTLELLSVEDRGLPAPRRRGPAPARRAPPSRRVTRRQR